MTTIVMSLKYEEIVKIINNSRKKKQWLGLMYGKILVTAVSL